ncbi:tyrosine--tRNA ligase [Patescibacteria group bacterium]|nr:tyrosine--tRNA ligase [Patescibacteria group bacterium]MBU1500936.1 tyrosine--tRNA ligase [Patescibacteria group bacterium]MBU2080567.1 tyrosine--tRNA ligase [Patescibacteria group bacterium]MBU2124357.1 tyrosine--tRNA ligase [Patescibacteria group bacterium]MBU2194484.1 tyrosine--tRNA ligase [Patescibacteria group bacterium]
MSLQEELVARGLVENTSAPLETILGVRRTVYLGVDPSADSMQAGNLVVVLLMKRLAEAGHNIVLLVGGGTGMIGDPRESGERALSDTKTVENNKKAIRAQMQQIIGKKVTLVDNADWLLKVKLVDFLRDIGKHFSVNELVKRDIIRRRLETPDESISYTEFAYSLLQGYDYLVLNKERGVDLQIGASDQWTNILSGVDLIRRKEGKEAFALTCPLVTDANGKKFGKSEGNAIWLNPEKTSPFEFYQFWLNQPDEMVEKYLKMYTFIPLEHIEEILAMHRSNPGAREAQETLARSVTELVHGPGATATAAAASSALFGKDGLSLLPREARTMLLSEAPSLPVLLSDVKKGLTIIDILATSPLASSKSDARRLVEAKGISLNGVQVSTLEQTLSPEDFTGDLALLKKGKREVLVLVLK